MMPRARLIGLMMVFLIPLTLGVWWPPARVIGIFGSAGLMIFSLIDLVLSPSPRKIDVQRQANDILSVGANNPVQIFLRNRNATKVTLSVHDEPPAPCDFEDLPFTQTLQPDKVHSQTYLVTPHHRGKNQFGTIFLQIVSRCGLWDMTLEVNLPQEVKIYPDIQAVRGVELLARMNRLAEAGVRLSRLKGRGSEFDRLREYRREDEYRSIDWKATARHNELISREYVVEKNQNVLFVLDSGRSMCNEHDGITHFDRALNAVILLSYIALRQGDTVGMLVGSNKFERWIPPVRGQNGVQSLIRQSYDLVPTYDATDYDMLTQQLRTRHRKRSLVVLVTHALDDVHLELIGRGMRQMRKPHLVLGGFLKNVQLHERLNTFPQTDREAFQIAAAAELVTAQTMQVKKLELSGLLVLNALPQEFSSGLISQYLEIKARHLL
jgi:uncharacterized protein (DUF58 family)